MSNLYERIKTQFNKEFMFIDLDDGRNSVHINACDYNTLYEYTRMVIHTAKTFYSIKNREVATMVSYGKYIPMDICNEAIAYENSLIRCIGCGKEMLKFSNLGDNKYLYMCACGGTATVDHENLYELKSYEWKKSDEFFKKSELKEDE